VESNEGKTERERERERMLEMFNKLLRYAPHIPVEAHGAHPDAQASSQVQGSGNLSLCVCVFLCVCVCVCVFLCVA